MTDEQFAALRATMPWREHVTNTARGAVIQIIDRNNQEVPLFAMARFLVYITNRLITTAPTKEKQ